LNVTSRRPQAKAAGTFAEEILPINIRGTTISIDDTIRPGVTKESLAGLKAVFPNWGPATTTAGNASGVGDGAALCILTTRERAEREGMQILGKWVASSVVGVEPRHMGISPIYAIPKLLESVGVSKEEVDVYEVGFLGEYLMLSSNTSSD
jgi:acetyl-CoA acyltransferase 1